jgi:hypothetical protein
LAFFMIRRDIVSNLKRNFQVRFEFTERVIQPRKLKPAYTIFRIDVDKSASHHLSQTEIDGDNACSQHLSGFSDFRLLMLCQSWHANFRLR